MLRQDWHRWCRGAGDISPEGKQVTVSFTNGRRQRVTVVETEDCYELTSVVVRAMALSASPDAELRAWRRNRSAQLVGFKIDARGRLVAETWVPKAGITADEFLTHLRQVSAEADLFEYQLTGKDRE